MVVYIRPNSSFVKTYILLVLRWILQGSGDFTWRVVSLDWITGGILARSLGGLGKKIN